jgi:site-specific DNA-methyltransferase (adenine-specific)
MINLYNMDCMLAMKEMKDKQFDLAIVDPPYGIGFDGENLSMSLGLRKDGSRRTDSTWRTKSIITTKRP